MDFYGIPKIAKFLQIAEFFISGISGNSSRLAPVAARLLHAVANINPLVALSICANGWYWHSSLCNISVCRTRG